MVIVFEAQLWEWDARKAESWTFVSLPEDESDEIKEITAGPRRGFGAVRVQATVGTTTWRTSIFPGGGGSAYVLPVKKAVRKAEKLDVGDTTTVQVELVDY